MHDRGTIQELAKSDMSEPADTWFAKIGTLLGGRGRNAGLIVALLALFIWTSAHNSHFATVENLRVIGLQMAFFAIAGVGMTMLLIVGTVDLSIGEIYALTAILSAELSMHMPTWLAIVAAIVAGGIIGAANGILVWNVKISPLIITLGSLSLLAGVNLLITHGYAVTGEPANYQAWGNAMPLGIPMPICVFAICAIVGAIFLGTTKQGKHIYAVGGSLDASRAAGLDVRLIVIGCFAFTGALCGLAGTLSGSEYGAPDPTYSVNFMLSVITGVILGGVSFAGGEGGIIGAMIGLAMLAMIDNSIVALSIDQYWAGVIKGAVLILAVSADQVAQVQRERRQKSMAMRDQSRALLQREQARLAAMVDDVDAPPRHS